MAARAGLIRPARALLVAGAHSRRRAFAAAGLGRIGGILAGAAALVTAEWWITARVADRLLGGASELAPLAAAVLVHGATLVVELAAAVAAASALTLALPVLAALEGEPFTAAAPLPAALRALQAWVRVASGLAWLAVLALPPLLVLTDRLRPGGAAAAQVTAAVALLLAAAAAAGTLAALLLARVVARRLLVPLAWSTTTLAAVGAVVWLRRLHPERLATAADPAALLAGLLALGGAPEDRLGWLVTGSLAGRPQLVPLLAATLALGALLLLAWGRLAPAAAHRLDVAPGPGRALRPLWRLADRLLAGRPTGALLAARLRLLVRDTAQGAQALYLLGLGVVYVENLRALPLGDPLAAELAGLVNLALAALLAAALALRFAYPAFLLEGGAAWWWRTSPLGEGRAVAALAAIAALPALGLAGGLYLAASLVTGGGADALWLVAWLAVWSAVTGVVVGPRTAPGEAWLDAALGAGGLGFLALALLGAGWTVTAAGARLLASIAADLDLAWSPGPLLASPLVPVLALTALTALLAARRLRA